MWALSLDLGTRNSTNISLTLGTPPVWQTRMNEVCNVVLEVKDQ